MKWIFRLVLSSIFINCFLLTLTFPQTNNSASDNTITIIFANATFIRTERSVVGWTRSIPANPLWGPTIGWDYKIDFTLKLLGNNFIWKNPIEIIFTLPDNSIVKEIINKELIPLYSDNLYDFSFNLFTKKRGYVKIDLKTINNFGYEEENNSIQLNGDCTFFD